MNKPVLQCGLLLALLAVILGAFGAHALKQILTPELQISFETGVRYQFYHALGLILLSVYGNTKPGKHIRVIFRLLLIGVLLFSGSIYILCFLKTYTQLSPGAFALLTPLGGLLMISGWGYWLYTTWITQQETE